MSRLPAALRDQAANCAALGSPFMHRLLHLLADHWPPDRRIAPLFERWQGDIGPAGASLPLRLAGGFHALVLTGRAPALAATYPPHRSDDAALLAALRDAMESHAAFLLEWVQSPPQTNEIRRSVALIPLAHWLADRFGLPLCLSEPGASGGLNLNFDRYGLSAEGRKFGAPDPALVLAPDWRGPLPPTVPFRVADRRGTDLNPLDPANRNDALRLLAYLWPDQADRLANTRAALTLPPAPVDRDDAAAWLEARLDRPRDGYCHLIYHTIAWQYFPAATSRRAQATIEAAGARATDTAPLAWFGMENDHGAGGPGAAMKLRLWPGNLRLDFGRVDFHGRWIDWKPGESC